MRFDITPETLDSGAKQVTLELGGQVINYAHGPQRAISVTWPGATGMDSARLVFDPPPSSGAPVLSATGPWALFRLFDQGTLQQAGSSERYTLTLPCRRPRGQFRNPRRVGVESVRPRHAARLPMPGIVSSVLFPLPPSREGSGEGAIVRPCNTPPLTPPASGRGRRAMTVIAGFYGKLPARGDFVRGALPRDFTDRWDAWLAPAIAGSRERMGEAWLPAFLEAPVWRFALVRRPVRRSRGAGLDAAQRGPCRPLFPADLRGTVRRRYCTWR